MDLASPRPPDFDHRQRGSALSRTARDPIVRTAEVNFTCPHCGSFYEVVRAKPSPEARDPRITCPTCGGPFLAVKRNSRSNTFCYGKPTAVGIARHSAAKCWMVTARVGERFRLGSEIDPRFPHRRFGANAARVRPALDAQQVPLPAVQSDPRLREAGATAFAPYRSHACFSARQHPRPC